MLDYQILKHFSNKNVSTVTYSTGELLQHNKTYLSHNAIFIFDTFSNGAANIFIIFFGSVAIVHLVKHLARKEAVSAFTDGVLCDNIATQLSLIGSRVV